MVQNGGREAPKWTLMTPKGPLEDQCGAKRAQGGAQDVPILDSVFLSPANQKPNSENFESKTLFWSLQNQGDDGTTTKDISSADICNALTEKGKRAIFIEKREDIPAYIATQAQPGDRIVVMGARDDTLPEFGRDIINQLSRAG